MRSRYVERALRSERRRNARIPERRIAARRQMMARLARNGNVPYTVSLDRSDPLNWRIESITSLPFLLWQMSGPPEYAANVLVNAYTPRNRRLN